MLDRAFAALTEGRRGPVLLDIPQDLQAEATELHHAPRHSRRGLGRPRGEAASIEAAARLLAGARRPVILAGGGVIAAGASPDLIALAERIGAAVTTTFMGKGAIPEDHDLYAYPLGDLGSISGNSLTRTADVILAIGCRFGDRVSSSYRDGVTFSIPGVSRLVQVDIDGSEIGKNYPAEVGIVGDAKSVLIDLLAALDGPKTSYRSGEYFAELRTSRPDG
jgi:acetolactate synthase I/II/III large subunit